jgi:hypothetical protein
MEGYNSHVKRLLGKFLTRISWLLLILAILFWLRSRILTDEFILGRNGYASDGTLIRRLLTIRGSGNYLQISFGHISSLLFDAVSPREDGFHHLAHTPASADMSLWVVWSLWGFSYSRMQNPMLLARIFTIPIWSLTLIFGILPAVEVVKRLRRSRRLSANRCASCGYDMRATPERCPECGTPSVSPAMSSAVGRISL